MVLRGIIIGGLLFTDVINGYYSHNLPLLCRSLKKYLFKRYLIFYYSNIELTLNLHIKD